MTKIFKLSISSRDNINFNERTNVTMNNLLISLIFRVHIMGTQVTWICLISMNKLFVICGIHTYNHIFFVRNTYVHVIAVYIYTTFVKSSDLFLSTSSISKFKSTNLSQLLGHPTDFLADFVWKQRLMLFRFRIIFST